MSDEDAIGSYAIGNTGHVSGVYWVIRSCDDHRDTSLTYNKTVRLETMTFQSNLGTSLHVLPDCESVVLGVHGVPLRLRSAP